jgi:hypothetical protein
MEILITESQLRGLLKEEYSEKIISQLLKKFIGYDDSIDNSNNIIDHEMVKRVIDYIKIFDKIKNNPDITNKDIFTHTLPELEKVVIDFMSKKKKLKSSKEDSDLDLVYRRNGLEIYRTLGQDKCIKYGIGYTFCVSSHGDENQYDNYRFELKGTPYFAFDRNLESSKDEDYADKDVFIDPKHLLVVFIHQTNTLPGLLKFEKMERTYDGEYIYYRVTEADNRKEKLYANFNLVEEEYPSLRGLKNIFEFVEVGSTDDEIKKLNIESYVGKNLLKINSEHNVFYGADPHVFSRFSNSKDFLKDKSMLKNHIISYRNKSYKTYSVKAPKILNAVDGTLGYEIVGMITGDNISETISNYIKTKIKNTEDNIQIYKSRLGDYIGYRGEQINRKDYIELLKKLVDEEKYSVVTHDWPPSFIEYISKLNKLYNDVVYMRWKFENEK